MRAACNRIRGLATVDDLLVPKTFYKWTDNDIAGEVPARLGSSNVRFLTAMPVSAKFRKTADAVAAPTHWAEVES